MTVAAAEPDSEENVHNQITHQRIRRHRRMPRMQGDCSGHNNECRMRMEARKEQNEEGSEGLKKEEQRHDRHLEKATMRSVEEGPRGSGAGREVMRRNQNDQPDRSMDDARGTKRSGLREEVLTKRETSMGR